MPRYDLTRPQCTCTFVRHTYAEFDWGRYWAELRGHAYKSTLCSNIDKARTKGLHRGPRSIARGRFCEIERSPRIERVLRHAKRDLLSARVNLAPPRRGRTIGSAR